MTEAPIKLNKEQMARGFAEGRMLIQEEWANPQEIAWLDELVAEGKAIVVADWKYMDSFQCERRKVLGVVK